MRAAGILSAVSILVIGFAMPGCGRMPQSVTQEPEIVAQPASPQSVAIAQAEIEQERARRAEEERLAKIEFEKKHAYEIKLRAKYADKVSYRTDYAKKVVENFNIDCRFPDERYLPLVNVLYASAALTANQKVWGAFTADSRGDEVRIYQTLYAKGGKAISDPALVYIVDSWGELHLRGGIRPEVIGATCAGSLGKIWRVD